MNSHTLDLKKTIPLILFLLAIITFDVLKVFPETMKWIDAKEEIKILEVEKREITTILEENKKRESDLQAQFDAEAKDSLLEEAQLLPEKFDIYHVTKTLELFSLQYSLLTATSQMKIERLSFAEGNDGKTLMTINLSCTKETLKNFIEYLQTGELPVAMIENDMYLEAKDLDYLQKHKLPLAQIDSINISDGKSSDLYKSITLKVHFFTQN